MRENNAIVEYRNRLDKTLSSPDLANVEKLKILVKDQIVSSSNVNIEEFIDKIVENRTKEVSNFLGMLRSASMNDIERSKYGGSPQGGWKVKQDTREFRVMYREGPKGTPFHTLLVEGYVDGPLDVCLCISTEAGLYPKWWPQTSIPTFKITSSQCLKKVRTGEQICLVRMKVSWPLSAREALMHYFEFEYFQDDLIIVLLNSIPDLENIDISTHGFTRDGIPDAQDVVRIDVVGGFALQKVSANRSYFRTIANMDIKLDFIPPSFINFISRQLIGSGFMLYKKEVASVSKGDEDFGKVLNDPPYARIREALDSKDLSTTAPEPEDIMNGTSVTVAEQTAGKDEVRTTAEMVHNDNLVISSEAESSLIQDKSSHSEIEEVKEENTEESQGLNQDDNTCCNLPTNQIAKRFCTGDRQEVVIRPEVEQALRTLEKAISIFREHVSNDKTCSMSSIPVKDTLNPDYDAGKGSLSSGPDQISRDGGSCAKVLNKEDPEIITSCEPRNSSGSHGSRRAGSSTFSRDTSHNKVAPALPDEEVPNLFEAEHTASYSSQNDVSALAVMEKIQDNNLNGAATIAVEHNRARTTTNRKPRFCCLSSFAR